MLVDKDKQLKVDNWGSFFLHRLFLLYEKGEKCDGTLLFKNGLSIKVHKLVLMTCTDYFNENLWVNDTFTLPPVLTHQAVLPIVNFMYTGFLNFSAEIHHSVFTAAKFLNVTILMKLLHAQLDNDVKPAIASQSAIDSGETTTATTTPTTSVSPSPPSVISSSSSSLPTPPPLSTSTPVKPSATTKSALRKVKRIPSLVKPVFLKTQSTSSPSSSSSSFSVVAASSSQTVPGKKLPFWKKRTTATTLPFPADFYLGGGGSVECAAAAALTAAQSQLPTEPSTPTRCELVATVEEESVEGGGADELQLLNYDVRMPGAECPSFNSINYSSQPIVKPLKNERKRPIDQLTKEINKLINKRPHLDSSCDKDTASKTNDNSRMEIIDDEDADDPPAIVDDDDDDDGHFDPDHTSTELIEMDETALSAAASKSGTTSKGVNGSSEDKFDRLAKSSVAACTPPKPILKPLTSECVSTGGGGGSSKKVRFSLAAEGKENTESANSVAVGVGATPKVATPTIAASSPLKGAKSTTTPVIGCSTKEVMTSRVSITGDKAAGVNATQIISELMKKNPDLMKNNKNIRVSIVSGGVSSASGVKVDRSDTETTKVRYIVMKQAAGKEGAGKVGAKVTSSGGAGQTPAVSGAENMTGPWLCDECGVAGDPMVFETYYLYRRHLHDVHQERIDARICEHCGYKSSKRNLHLYHLYTKHNVAPPRNIRFPKCDKCNYIALSDSLLIKHNNNHASSSEKVSCKACNITFKSQATLQCHNQVCPNVSATASDLSASLTSSAKEYSCQYCQKTFNRSINLKAHMRIAHKNESRRMYDEDEEEATAVTITPTTTSTSPGDDESSSATNNLLQVIRLPAGGSCSGGEQRALLLPAGMFLTTAVTAGAADATDASGGVVASTEQEAMTTVASGIAASLNLADGSALMAGDQTVILLDGSSELVFEPGNAVMLQSSSQGTSGTGCTEYIVPEIIAADHVNHLFQAHAAAEVVDDSAPDASHAASDESGGPDDHTYADETEQLEQQMNEQSLPANTTEATLPEGPSIIVVPSDEQMTQDADGGTPASELAGNCSVVATESLSEEVAATSPSNGQDNCTNIVEEACKRDTIIIETCSVAAAATTAAHAQNSDSVIVAPRIDLAKDWDDLESGDHPRDEPSDVPSDEQSDEQRPSRASIDMAETILPDMC